jgi:hypothetical protein
MLPLTNAVLTATAVALTCMAAPRAHDSAATAADDANGPAEGAPTTTTMSQNATQTAVIHDPVLDMDAYKVVYPAKWHYQGTMVQGSPCSPVPSSVFRLTSPGGLTQVERMPSLDWFWSNSPTPTKTPDGCLPLKSALSAREFLKYLSAILKVEYVGEQPIDPAILAANAKQFADFNAKSERNMGPGAFIQTNDLAAAIVRYKNGTFLMEGIIQANVLCNQSSLAILGAGKKLVTTTCNAGVRYTHGPAAKFKDVLAIATDTKIGASTIAAWMNAWGVARTALLQRQGDQILAAQRQTIHQQNAMLRNQMQQSNQQLAAQHDQFEQGQAMRQQQHEDFLSTMQRGTDMSMRQAAQVANSNHTIAADWVDYSLDQQTVRDPTSGQVSKVSSASSYTWIDASGKTSFQTNDPNADPNGTQPGTWTRQQTVHGDGTP